MFDSKGNPISGDVQININKNTSGKNADRQALKKQAGAVHPTFESMDALVASAEKTFKNVDEKEKDEDLANGFDIDNSQSVLDFQIDYTPVKGMIVKFIKETLKQGSIFLLDGSLEGKRAIVMVPPLYDTLYKKGDVITFLPSSLNKSSMAEYAWPLHVKRKFNNVNFQEIDLENIGGIMKKREEVLERLK